MSNIFSWIGLKEQRRITIQARRHMEKVVSVIELLAASLQVAAANQAAEVSRLHGELARQEHEADIIRRDLLIELSISMWSSKEKRPACQALRVGAKSFYPFTNARPYRSNGEHS